MSIDQIDQNELTGMLAELTPLPALEKALKPIATKNAIRWAIRQKVVNPVKIGCYTLFAPGQVKELLHHFAH